jgi:hypothetical protein
MTVGIVDFDAISQAIVDRFSPANVTAPVGEETIKFSTDDLPDTITDEPCVLVYPPNVVITTSNIKSGIATFPVRFYIYKTTRTNKRNSALIRKWMNALYAQFDAAGDTYLQLPAYVTGSSISALRPGALRYWKDVFNGIEFTVDIPFQEAYATA